MNKLGLSSSKSKFTELNLAVILSQCWIKSSTFSFYNWVYFCITFTYTRTHVQTQNIGWSVHKQTQNTWFFVFSHSMTTTALQYYYPVDTFFVDIPIQRGHSRTNATQRLFSLQFSMPKCTLILPAIGLAKHNSLKECQSNFHFFFLSILLKRFKNALKTELPKGKKKSGAGLQGGNSISNSKSDQEPLNV